MNMQIYYKLNFKAQGKYGIFNTWCLDWCQAIWKNIKCDSDLTSYAKIKSRWILFL